jgi:ATPase subunit of ABC transporter with duplicated ATPase domains
MLLLDEPTNHLDAESGRLAAAPPDGSFPGCVILVTHDRYFLDQVTKWTLELDRGRGNPHEGNYSAWLEPRPSAGAGGRARRRAGRKRAC